MLEKRGRATGIQTSPNVRKYLKCGHIHPGDFIELTYFLSRLACQTCRMRWKSCRCPTVPRANYYSGIACLTFESL